MDDLEFIILCIIAFSIRWTTAEVLYNYKIKRRKEK